MFADNIKEERTPEDLFFHVMLNLGIMLSSDIEETEIAKQHSFYAIFRDSGMASDSVLTNFEQIFETYSPRTQRKVL